MYSETRKYNVSLTLAHQSLSHFSTQKIDALSSVGSTIIFNVDAKDARRQIKNLRGRVKGEDIIALERGHGDDLLVDIDVERPAL